jgi:hypothetical protein
MDQPAIYQVDRSSIKVSQTITMLLLTTAFVLDNWPLAAFVASANLLGAVAPQLALFPQIYHRLLKPSGLIKPQVVPDYPEPHRFAQMVSGGVTALSAALIWSGYALSGWTFSWLIILLAGLNVFVGFCAGCFMYYQLNRLGVPGFQRSPVRR